MTHTPPWRRYLRFWRADVGADVDDELRFHFESRIDSLVGRGMSPEAARARALQEFGDVAAVRAGLRAIDERASSRRARAAWWDALGRDLRFAARTLRRSPGFTVVAAACIALGVCATTTIFSAVHAILIRPLPYPRADELVTVYAEWTTQNARGVNISYPDYVSWRDESRVFAALGIWTWGSYTLADGGEPERLEGAWVSANLFPILGVAPLLGRGFLPEEQVPGRDRVVLLSHGLWRRRFGGDRGTVGRAIAVNGTPRTVVGVMPAGFHFPDRAEVWVPFDVDPAKEERGNRGYAAALGRLRPGVSFDRAAADLATLSARLAREFPENVGWAAQPVPLREDLVGDLRRPLLVFFGAVGLVLFISCANVAGLLLARGTARQRETAIRAAIGASRGRIVRQLLAESLLLAALGGAAGTALAVWGVRLLRLSFPDVMPANIALGIDRTALAFAVAVTALTGVGFGLAPALRATRSDPDGLLREGARGASEGPARRRLQSGLVVGEVALSLVLLVGAALLVRSYRALEGMDLGFRERGILSFRLTLARASYGERARVAAFYEQLLERVRALPGVEAVGSAQGIPFSGWNLGASITLAGRPPASAGEQPTTTHHQIVSPDYFSTIGVPLLRGRALSPADRDTIARVAVVNESFVNRYFPGEDVLGRRVKFGGPESTDPWMTIVGVYRDFRHYRLPEPMGPALYLPFAASPVHMQTLAIRTSLADPMTLVPAVKDILRALDPTVPIYQVQTFEQVVARALWRQRLQGQVLGVFAALALLLAVVGIYGVIAYAVTQRTRELGVRIALGATRPQILALVLGQGARLALAGIAIGVVAALGLTRAIASLLYGVRPTDPLTYVAVPAALAAVTLAATYLPARRATRVDPMIAMRAE